jgi:hypothetical protein
MLGVTMTQAQVKLAFKPETGSKYTYQTEIVQDIKQSAMGRELPIEETVTMGFLMDIQNSNGKETGAQFSLQDVSYLLSSPMMKMSYDSKKPTENPNALDKIHEKIFGSVLGKSYVLSIAPDGSVNSVTGVDAVIVGIAQAVAADGEMGAQLSSSLTSQWLGESAIKGMFEQTFRVFPSNGIKPGDSWTIESNYGVSNKKSDIKTLYSLQDVKDGVATISVKATVELNPGGGLEGTLTGTQSGILLVDAKTGIPVSSDLTLNIKGPVKQQQVEIQMEMAAKMKTTVKEIN